jgi:hypothetical protein
MAGVKITDLVAITEAASNDLLYIVDVSNTTESPQGTSSQIEVGNILSSGTWTPTFSGENAACSNPTLTKAQYSRVGNIVNCTIYGSVDLDFTTYNGGSFNFDYPFAPTNDNSIGVVSKRDNPTDIVTGYVRYNTIYFESSATTDLSTNLFFAIFQYEID